jgi:hypothetical protein
MYRDNDDVQQTVGEFLDKMPRSLEEVYEMIPEARVEAYRQSAVAATVAQIREFIPD